MESKAVSVYPFEKVDISAFQKVFTPDQEKIQAELDRLRNKKIVWQAAEMVEKGDVVVCRMRSELAKYNRDPVRITVGLGLFDRELEQRLYGLNVGVRLSIERQGKLAEVELQEILRKRVPDLQDDFVLELGIPEVDSVEGYRRWLAEEQKKEALREDKYYVMQHIFETVFSESSMEISPEDCRVLAEGEMARLGAIASWDNQKLEEMTEEDFIGKIPVRSYQELVELVNSMARKDVQIALAGYALAALRGYAFEQEEQEGYFRDKAQDLKLSLEECYRTFPQEYVQMHMAIRYYYFALNDYISENLYIEG